MYFNHQNVTHYAAGFSSSMTGIYVLNIFFCVLYFADRSG